MDYRNSTKLKPNGAICNIVEQIIEDPVSELTFQFEVAPDGTTRVLIYGNLVRGNNRELVFDKTGRCDGAGMYLGQLCKPAWLTDIDEL